jgi:hypothetical protein
VSSHIDALERSQRLVDAIISFFDMLRSSMRCSCPPCVDLLKIVNSTDCRSIDSLQRSCQDLQAIGPTYNFDYSIVSSPPFEVADHSRAANYTDCLRFNARFVASACSNASRFGIGFIRRLTTRATHVWYSKLNNSVLASDEERNV